MKQELFNTYFSDVSRWIKKSRELMIAARYLICIENDIFRTGNDVIGSYEIKYHPFQAWASLVGAASLLIGLALENLLKGCLIHLGKIYIDKNNKIKGLTKNHDLLQMIENVDYRLSDEERLSLKRLTFSLQSLSKYHIAPSPQKQAEFTGQTDNPVNSFKLIIKIVRRILPAEYQSYFFQGDSSYDHIPLVPNFTTCPWVNYLMKGYD